MTSRNCKYYKLTLPSSPATYRSNEGVWGGAVASTCKCLCVIVVPKLRTSKPEIFRGSLYLLIYVLVAMQNPTAVSSYSSSRITREPKKLTVNTAIRELSEFDNSNWSQLGINLGVPQHQRNSIAANIAGKPHGQGEALTSVLDFWLRNDLEASWEKLASAVEMSSGVVLANKIRISLGIPPSGV